MKDLRQIVDEALTRTLAKHKGFQFSEDCSMLIPLDLTQGINVDTLTEAVLEALLEAMKVACK